MIRTVILGVVLTTTLALAQEKAPPADGATAVSQPSKQYVIGPEDVVSVNVWKEPEVSRVVPVRPDGKIALPLAGEFEAAGKTAPQLESEIRAKLQSMIQNPQVTVIVQEVKSQKFSIVGEVNHPGTFALDRDMTVLEALAVAGGLKDFANTKKIYILRRDDKGAATRVKVNYKDLLSGKTEKSSLLQARDTVVVP